MARQTLKCFFEMPEYRAIRMANMRGQLNAALDFCRAENGEVSFTTTAPLALCDQLERIVDFGATSAYEVLQPVR